MASVVSQLRVDNVPSNKYALTNRVYVSPADFAQLKGSGIAQGVAEDVVLVALDCAQAGEWVFAASELRSIAPGSIAMSGMQRRCAQLVFEAEVPVFAYAPPADAALSTIKLNVDLLSKKGAAKEVRRAPCVCPLSFSCILKRTPSLTPFRASLLFPLSLCSSKATT